MSELIIRKPLELVKKEQKKKTLDRIWPKIVDHITANPSLTDDDLFIMYGSYCNSGDKAKFIRRCKLRGLNQLRESMNGRDRNTHKESRQLTEKRVLTIEERRKKGGVKFIKRMDKVVMQATESIEAEANEVTAGKAHLGNHIVNIKNLVKVGKEVYNIDADNGEDRAKMNIAILMGFNPLENQKEVIDI